MASLRDIIMNNKTYWGLWVVFGIFWIIGFSFLCAELSHGWFKGHQILATIDDVFSPDSGGDDDDDDDDDDGGTPVRIYPGWILCPGIPSNSSQPYNITQLSGKDYICQECIINQVPDDDDDSDFCNQTYTVTPKWDTNTNCWVFNGPMTWQGTTFLINETYWGSFVQCFFALENTPKARLYLFDQTWPEAFQSPNNKQQLVLPDGAVQRTLPVGTRNIVEIQRSTYIFRDHHDEYGWKLMDGESYQDVSTQVSLMIYYGTSSEWTYTQDPHNGPYGYGFWDWVGSIGGLTMICYVFHTFIFAIISRALGWNEMPTTYEGVNG